MINPLLDLITEHNMILTLPPNIPTYKTTTSNWTHPDNVWHNDNPDNPIPYAMLILPFALHRPTTSQ